MKITVAQLNPLIGDIDGNLAKARDALARADRDTSDLVVFPELFLTGYPPRDLLHRPHFITRVQGALDGLVQTSRDYPETGIVMGAPTPAEQRTGHGLYNTALLIYRGEILLRQHKSLLPTYDVFDEARYFDAAQAISPVPFKGERLGITVCEDAWNASELWQHRNYDRDPIQELADGGATVLINISASPFNVGKERTRFRIMQHHARKHRLASVLVNQIGGNDELVFDGRSLCVDASGDPVAVLPAFRERIQTVDTRHKGTPGSYAPQDDVAGAHDALVLGLRDYVRKCGFRQAVLGLSGGIDSAVVCCLAKEALGSENIAGISMPSRYSSRGSVEDSRDLARNLGIDFSIIPISPMYDSFLESLSETFAGTLQDSTEENLQARIRGTILMSFSNKFGHLLLSTGNKSEIAVGYCTMYGDMAGGLAVISDVPKTMVYAIARYINRNSEIIPQAIIEKAPSAELRPDQKDQDTLPPYEILDPILRSYIDEGRSTEAIIAMGHDPEVVRWIVKTIDRNEYKRRQAAPGLKVTTKAFGCGRRMVIAAKYDQ